MVRMNAVAESGVIGCAAGVYTVQLLSCSHPWTVTQLVQGALFPLTHARMHARARTRARMPGYIRCAGASHPMEGDTRVYERPVSAFPGAAIAIQWVAFSK